MVEFLSCWKTEMASEDLLFEKTESAGCDQLEIGQYVSLITKDIEVTYDGEEHSAAVPDVVCSGCNEKDCIIEYSENGIDWSTDPSFVSATKVRDSKDVYVRVSGNGLLGYVEGTEKITIKPKAVVLRVNDADKAVGDNDPAFLGNGDQAGFIVTDDIGIRYSRTDVSDNSIGVHKGVLTADVLYGNTEDYDITIVPGDLTINDVEYGVIQDSSTSQDIQETLSAPSVPQSMPETFATSVVPQSVPGNTAGDVKDKSESVLMIAGEIILIAISLAAIVCLIYSKVQGVKEAVRKS